MSAGDVLFRLGGVSTIASSDLLVSYAERSGLPAEEGQIAWMRDKFGALRLFTFRKNVSGSAFAVGDLTSRTIEIETNISAGTKTSATGTWDAADHHQQAVFIVHDNNSAAGGAPEGEASIIASNSATVVTLEPDLPMSTDLEINDDVTIFSPKLVDAAATHPNHRVCGVAMSPQGDDEWGWHQFHGLHPAVKHTAATCTAGQPVSAGAAAVAASGSDAAYLWVGNQVATHTSDVGTTKSPVVMTLLVAYT